VSTCTDQTTSIGLPRPRSSSGAVPAGRPPYSQDMEIIGSTDRLRIPVPSVVVLVGPSGSGKSTLARRLFGPYEVLSSDYCRGLISDFEDDQSVTPAAFALLRHIAGLRLSRGRLVVVDATNVHLEARAHNLALADRCRVPAVAIVLAVSLNYCLENNRKRQDRQVPEGAIHSQFESLKVTLKTIDTEGFGRVVGIRETTAMTVQLEREEMAAPG
jgi:predicted kinase